MTAMPKVRLHYCRNKSILTTIEQKEIEAFWEKSWKYLCAGICTQFHRAVSTIDQLKLEDVLFKIVLSNQCDLCV